TDVTFMEPTQLAEMAGTTEEEADEMILFAEEEAERIEREGEPEPEPAPAPAEGEMITEQLVEGEPGVMPEGMAVADGDTVQVDAPQVSADMLAAGPGGEAAVVGAGGFEALFAPDAPTEVVVESTGQDGVPVEDVVAPVAEAPAETPPPA